MKDEGRASPLVSWSPAPNYPASPPHWRPSVWALTTCTIVRQTRFWSAWNAWAKCTLRSVTTATDRDPRTDLGPGSAEEGCQRGWLKRGRGKGAFCPPALALSVGLSLAHPYKLIFSCRKGHPLGDTLKSQCLFILIDHTSNVCTESFHHKVSRPSSSPSNK